MRAHRPTLDDQRTPPTYAPRLETIPLPLVPVELQHGYEYGYGYGVPTTPRYVDRRPAWPTPPSSPPRHLTPLFTPHPAFPLPIPTAPPVVASNPAPRAPQSSHAEGALSLSLSPELDPSLCPALSEVVWDVRMNPDEGAVQLANFGRHSMLGSRSRRRDHQLLKEMIARPALRSNPQSIRIISKNLWWTIDVHAQSSRRSEGLRTKDLYRAIYRSLQREVTDPEWEMADVEVAERAEMAMRAREPSLFGGTLRRVDWLGDDVYFRGLIRGNEGEVWNAVFSSSPW